MGEPVKIVIDDFIPIKKDGFEIEQKAQTNSSQNATINVVTMNSNKTTANITKAAANGK